MPKLYTSYEVTAYEDGEIQDMIDQLEHFGCKPKLRTEQDGITLTLLVHWKSRKAQELFWDWLMENGQLYWQDDGETIAKRYAEFRPAPQHD